MIGVTRWTGREVSLLRQAMRLTITDFGELVGTAPRQVSRWAGRGETLTLSLAYQKVFDTVLAQAEPAAQQRFALLLTERAALQHDEHAEELLRTCARTSTHPGDGKLMVLIEEGIYLSGPNKKSVWVDSFMIDAYPTSNRDYERFIRSTGHCPPQHWPEGRCPAALAAHPVVWVTWRDANAYARWADKTLPTASQWEKAARGTNGRTYPWGDDPTAAKANVAETGIGSTTPVFRYQSGASPYGAFDMCGNVWEWCATPGNDGPNRYELKGSAFTSPFERAAPSLKNTANSTMKDNDTGFRCASMPMNEL